MVRHPGMSNNRKVLTVLRLKGLGGEMCYQSPVPAEAEGSAPLAGTVALEEHHHCQQRGNGEINT